MHGVVTGDRSTSGAGTTGPWINYAAAIWAIQFGAPHLWWALGITAGFPGGERNHQIMMESWWRYLFDVVVVLLSALAVLVALAPVRLFGARFPRWIPRAMAWTACGMLGLRGVAGMVVDGLTDGFWWQNFLAGSVLFGGVAWFASTSPGTSRRDLAAETR